jgi:hypothetical protein
MKSCKRLGIERIVIVVPGYKGFLSDKTHRTFVDKEFLINHRLIENEDFRLISCKYFPFNLPVFGKFLTHNETLFVFERF